MPGVKFRFETAMFLMRLGGVEGRGLVEPVIERVEQAVIEPEAAAHRRLAIAPHVPGKANARIGQELRAVGRRAPSCPRRAASAARRSTIA